MKFLVSAGALLGGCVLAVSVAGAGEIPLSDHDLDRITAAQSLLRTSGGIEPSLTGVLNPEPPPPPPPPPPIGGGGGGQPPAPTLPTNGLVFSDGGGTFVIGVPTGPEGSQGAISVLIVPSSTGNSGAASVRIVSEGSGTVISNGITGFASFSGD
jgi:hypothetical protein